jgi:hypothetical protein
VDVPDHAPIDGSRQGREGSRWINKRPTGEEVAEWFADSVPIHDGMEHADYVSGVTIIPAKERYDTIGYRGEEQTPVVGEMLALTFTPYIRVDTRIRYFWDLMERHPEWIGTIERVPVGQQEPTLPDGFFYQTVKKADGKEVIFIGCSMRVKVRHREEDTPVLLPPAATKMVPVLGKYGEDTNAMMKAETGAIGRALGFAGILVAPGSGIATAEDMQESISLAGGAGAAPAEPAEPQLPPSPEPEDEESLRKYAEDKLIELKDKYPHSFEEFQEWAQSRKFRTLADVDGPALKGLVRKLDTTLDEAVANAPKRASDDEDEGPALVDAPKPAPEGPEPASEPEPEQN